MDAIWKANPKRTRENIASRVIHSLEEVLLPSSSSQYCRKRMVNGAGDLTSLVLRQNFLNPTRLGRNFGNWLQTSNVPLSWLGERYLQHFHQLNLLGKRYPDTRERPTVKFYNSQLQTRSCPKSGSQRRRRQLGWIFDCCVFFLRHNEI